MAAIIFSLNSLGGAEKLPSLSKVTMTWVGKTTFSFKLQVQRLELYLLYNGTITATQYISYRFYYLFKQYLKCFMKFFSFSGIKASPGRLVDFGCFFAVCSKFFSLDLRP